MNGKYHILPPSQNKETAQTHPTTAQFPYFHKLLEKRMAQLLTEHMVVHSPISPHQWGFCKGKSITGALALAVDQWHRHLEEGNNICTVFFDYRKAFAETYCLNWNLLALTHMYRDG